MRALSICSAGILLFAGTSQAEFVDVAFLGTGKGQTLKISSPEYNGNVFVGQLQHHLSNGSAALNGDWITYCSDLAQYVSSSTTQFEVVSASLLPDNHPMGAAKAQAIADMYAYASGSQLLSSTSNDLASAFQLALWEVINDYDTVAVGHNLNLASGSFSALMADGSALSAGISVHVASLLGAIGSNAALEGLYGIRSGSRQDQILQVIPAPTALAALGLGLAGAGSRRRK